MSSALRFFLSRPWGAKHRPKWERKERIVVASGLALFVNVFLPWTLGAQSPWVDVSATSDWTFPVHSQLHSYRGLSLDLLQFRTQIGTLDENGFSFIVLPNPDGGFDTCTVWEDPVLPAGLAAKYPEIQTYSGYLNSDRRIQVRIDLGARGLHAMVFGNGAHWFVDPGLSGGALSQYASYHKLSAKPYYTFVCHNTDPIEFPGIGTAMAGKTEVAVSQGLRTYRLGVSTTGEYGSFHGGHVPTILSAIVTQVHRVNGFYSRDLSIKFMLAEKTDYLLFSDPATDPFTNLDPFALVLENQFVLDSVLGDTAYDIGHNFGTGTGGYGPGLSCAGGEKAQGLVGGPIPVGDAFDADYLAHEIGHQFGANHTYNNPCNRIASAAYEPGSGSTLMGLAGVCAPNLQDHFDSYFHHHSIGEVQNFLQNGPGAPCAPLDTNQNSSPGVLVPSSHFALPHSTPFRLRGSAVDPGQTAWLTYTWEQYNLGPAGAPNSPSGNAPLFRSVPPTASGERVFPAMKSLLDGVPSTGEHLPTYGRTMRFRLVVRDNYPSSGALGTGQVDCTVDGNSGPFAVVQPSASQGFHCLSNHAVLWSVNGTHLPPVSCQWVNVYFSPDNGAHFSDTLATGIPNNGQWNWTVPDGYETPAGRILVEAVGNHFFALSEAFEILPSIGLEEPSVDAALRVFPQPTRAGGWVHIATPLLDGAEWTLWDLSGRALVQGQWNPLEPRSIRLPPVLTGHVILGIREADGTERRAKIWVLPY